MDADSNIRTYPDIGAHAFGNVGRVLVSIFTNAELYLVITGFLIVEGDNLHNLFPHMEVEVAGMRIGGKLGFIILVAIVILPTVWVDNLSLLSYISASGVLASAIILGSIFWTGAFDGVGFQQKGTLINWKGLPTAVSLYAFCYCAHPVFPDMYTSMKSRHQFSIVLFLCFTLCTICYAAMAVLGYLMFGSDVQSQVTLNLPVEKFSSRLAIYTTLVNPIAKYALMMTPVVKSIRPRLPYRCNKKAFSSAIMISTVIVALTVPFFGQLMSLVGAFLSMSASIVIPCLCYLKISGAYRRFQFEVVVILGVLVLAVMVGILGTYTAILQIVGNF
ncbi:hypothetical protein K2173_020137 [Erythroxylum novogranatense]|uniref:Amino acid transporter transmembrane domain-containing protein n=1 Tax=Erythroxylum novogranatense TaxID=1862640 RepID=A0AAV8UA04_9ROSI|nr:hypothetical protein K2173_020137 [Erythroxylum novogranatense]